MRSLGINNLLHSALFTPKEKEMNRFFTSESVTEGHPDKVCDQVSDAVLDAILEQDANARVACECCCCEDFLLVMGEITTKAKVDIDGVARETIKKIGYDKDEYLRRVIGKENCLEGGARCEICFRLRLEKTAEFAKNHGYDCFATTLTVSPLKNAEKINRIGEEVAYRTGVKYIHTDFKKREGYKKSIELSKKYDLYRQNYCGCEFSKT